MGGEEEEVSEPDEQVGRHEERRNGSMTGKRDGGGDGKSICGPVVVNRGGVGTSRDKDNRSKGEEW